MSTSMKLSAAFLPLILLGCAPDIPSPFDQDGAPMSGDAAEVSISRDTPLSEVVDGSVDTQVVDTPDSAQPVDAVVLPDAPQAVDTAASDAGVDALDVVDVVDVVDARALLDTPDVQDVRDVPDVQDVRDVQDVSDTPDVLDVPVIPMDLGPPPCLPGQDRCGGAVCLNLSTNITNCGGCGNACPARLHAPATCSGGSCTLVCDTGYLNCDGNLTNGCETTPSTDALNCGGCGMVCPTRPNTAPSMCVGGTCSFGCGAGFANCDGNLTNGCEVSTATDPMNCGACGRACGAGQTCAGGTCLCPSGQAPCGGACPNLATDVNNCGACGWACALNQGCCGGVCATLDGYGDRCGACNRGCGTTTPFCVYGYSISNAVTASCAAACPSPRSNSGTRGPCVNLQTDHLNCGSFRNICPLNNICTGGVCVACPAGHSICGTRCVNLTTDSDNCGACNAWCGAATRTCSMGRCV